MKTSGKLFVAAAALTAGATLTGDAVCRAVLEREVKIPDALARRVSGGIAPSEESMAFYQRERAWIETQPVERVPMTNALGQKLMGHLLLADAPSDVFVLISHGYRSDGIGESLKFARFYHERGYNLLMPDHQAHGESEGRYIGFGHYESADCMQWLTYLLDRFGASIQLVLHGVSMGSATVMLMSGKDSLPAQVRMIVADCGYTSAWTLFQTKLGELHIPTFPLLPIANLACRLRAGYNFRQTDALAAVRKARVPMLFVHGGADTFIPPSMGRQLYEACGSADKDLLIVDGASHAESFLVDPAAYGAKLNEFFQRCLLPAKAVC